MKYMLNQRKLSAAICLLAILQGMLCVLTACSTEKRYTSKSETGYSSVPEASFMRYLKKSNEQAVTHAITWISLKKELICGIKKGTVML